MAVEFRNTPNCTELEIWRVAHGSKPNTGGLRVGTIGRHMLTNNFTLFIYPNTVEFEIFELQQIVDKVNQIALDQAI